MAAIFIPDSDLANDSVLSQECFTQCYWLSSKVPLYLQPGLNYIDTATKTTIDFDTHCLINRTRNQNYLISTMLVTPDASGTIIVPIVCLNPYIIDVGEMYLHLELMLKEDITSPEYITGRRKFLF